MRLDASQSWDPDRDELQFTWMNYREPSATQWTCDFEVPKLEFEDVSTKKNMEKVEVRIPGKDEGSKLPLDETKIMKWGAKTYHSILEIVDNGKYPMRAYRRVLVKIVDKNKAYVLYNTCL